MQASASLPHSSSTFTVKDLVNVQGAVPAEGVPGVISSATTEIGPSQLSVAVSTSSRTSSTVGSAWQPRGMGAVGRILEYRCCRVILVAECHRAGVCIVAALVIDIHGERLGERAGCGAEQKACLE